jgi:hypothetical protein
VVTFGSAGAYQYYCSIHGSPTAGLRGRVTVRYVPVGQRVAEGTGAGILEIATGRRASRCPSDSSCHNCHDMFGAEVGGERVTRSCSAGPRDRPPIRGG